MSELLGYRGKTAIVTGAASGMGQATAAKLQALGARVYALDIATIPVAVERAIEVDLSEQASIDHAIAQLPAEIDCLFNCAGVPSPPFSADKTLLINFVGLRYLTEQLLPRFDEGGSIASIASTAGMGWRAALTSVQAFLALEADFDSAKTWLTEQAEPLSDGYGFSKQCLIVYTMQMAGELAKRGIRINCIAPSPTDSQFMQLLKGEGQMPSEAIDLFLPPHGRYASGDDMADPLIWLNSQMAGFVSGINLPVDFGYSGQVFTGQRDNLLNIS